MSSKRVKLDWQVREVKGTSDPAYVTETAALEEQAQDKAIGLVAVYGLGQFRQGKSRLFVLEDKDTGTPRYFQGWATLPARRRGPPLVSGAGLWRSVQCEKGTKQGWQCAVESYEQLKQSLTVEPEVVSIAAKPPYIAMLEQQGVPFQGRKHNKNEIRGRKPVDITIKSNDFVLK